VDSSDQSYLGAIIMTIGSLLVIFDITGYYLAGLVYAVGAAFIGCWVLIANRLPPYAGELPRGVRVTGLAAGMVMLVGLLSVPGVLARVDDQNASPWYLDVRPAELARYVPSLSHLVLPACSHQRRGR
jgi:hypothetical protein